VSDACARYVDEVIRLYRATPTVLGHVRRVDRLLARRLHEQQVPLQVVRDAFILGAARRVLHNGFSSPMPPVRSLHYFVPLIREVLDRPPGYRELQQLVAQLRLRSAAWEAPPGPAAASWSNSRVS
jgi:hypothetical protein